MKIIDTLVFKINGLVNNDHAREITFALDKAGFDFAVIDQDCKELIIPQSYISLLDRIKLVIESVGRYKLVV